MEPTYNEYNYAFMALTLFLSFSFGMYQASFKNQRNSNEYLHGGKNMNFLIVSLSIISSGLRGTSLISTPTNVYYFGITYILNWINYIFIGLISYFWIMPVFFKLQLTSIYQYLELRFDVKTKAFCSFLYIVQVFLFLPLALHTTGSTISQVSGINFHIIVPAISAVCIIYTVFGGIKASIWTDALHCLVITVLTITIISLGTVEVGGFIKMFHTAYKTKKMRVDFNMNPTKEETFWTVYFSNLFQLLGLFVLTQDIVQKYLCLKAYDHVKKTHFVSLAGLSALVIFSGFWGLLIVAKYLYCDPISMKSTDDILAYFIMDIGKSHQSLSGMFTAGIVSLCFSVLSPMLNSVSATVYNDFLKSVLPEKLCNKNEIQYLKLLGCTIGISCTLIACFLPYFSHFTSLFSSLVSVITAPLTGLFIIGLFMPNVNAKGALWGALISLFVMFWVAMSAEWYKFNNFSHSNILPVHNHSCPAFPNNYKFFNIHKNNGNDVPYLYKISYRYYTILGILLLILVSFAISHLTKTKEHVDGKYLSPSVHWFRRKFCKKSTDYDIVDETLNCNNET